MNNNRKFPYAVAAAFLASVCFDGLADTPTYNDNSRILELPILNIGGTYYYGIQVRLDNIHLLRNPTGSGTCDPGIRMDLAAQPDFSCFPDQPSFDAALTGTWVSGSDYPGKIALTFSSADSGTGGFSTYTTLQTDTAPKTTYRNCSFSLSPLGSSPDVGYRPYALASVK